MNPIKKDKGLFVAGGLCALLIISGAIAYYNGQNAGGGSTNDSSSSLSSSSTITRSQVAKSTQAQANAYSVQSVAEVYAAENVYYPATAAEFMSYNKTISLPKGINVLPDSKLSPINADNGTDSVAWSCLKTCTNATGGKITYWDYKTNAISTQIIYTGDADDSSTFVNPVD